MIYISALEKFLGFAYEMRLSPKVFLFSNKQVLTRFKNEKFTFSNFIDSVVTVHQKRE